MSLFKRAENETSFSDGTRAHVLITNGKESTDREYIKVMIAQGNKFTEQEVQCDQVRNASRPFRFFR